MSLFLIAAIARDGALGVTRDGKPGLPWPKLVHDQAWFRSLTQSGKPLALARQWCHEERSSPYGHVGPQNAVVMGRRTWESLPGPLANRQNIVITSRLDKDIFFHALSVTSFDGALLWAQHREAPHTFVIGGARLFAEALLRPELEAMLLTEVDAEYPEADTWWPAPQWHPSHGRCLGLGEEMLPVWHRELVSPWIEEPDAPRYRFWIWRRRHANPQ